VLADAVFEIRSGGVKMYLQDGKLLNAEAVQEIIGMPVSADGAEAAMASEKISSTFTFGEIDISGFSYDVVYELKEITPPDGYIIVNGSTYLKAVRNNTQTYLRLTDQNGTVLADDDNNPILENDYAAVSENGLSISVKNEPGAALPNTGGPGTNLIYIFGIMLTGLAGVGLVMKRRRRNAA
jgi:LPXTG-motif cell wall-anchored protein